MHNLRRLFFFVLGEWHANRGKDGQCRCWPPHELMPYVTTYFDSVRGETCKACSIDVRDHLSAVNDIAESGLNVHPSDKMLECFARLDFRIQESFSLISARAFLALTEERNTLTCSASPVLGLHLNVSPDKDFCLLSSTLASSLSPYRICSM